MDKNIKFFSKLICPVCKSKGIISEFEKTGNSVFIKCWKGHSFDRAKEGYINLAPNAGNKAGDSKEMVLARKNFLNKGYYDVLAEALFDIIKKYDFKNLLDACCGEGYFTNKISDRLSKAAIFPEISAFDLSKSAIARASKDYNDTGIFFFVANIKNIPVENESVNCLTHLFAPLNGDEFYRILDGNGIFIHVIPAKRHLWQLKKILYKTPYENDENAHLPPYFKIEEAIRVKSEIDIQSNADIQNLLLMTPYAFRTPEEGKEKISRLNSLKTETEFIINICKKVCRKG